MGRFVFVVIILAGIYIGASSTWATGAWFVGLCGLVAFVAFAAYDVFCWVYRKLTEPEPRTINVNVYDQETIDGEITDAEIIREQSRWWEV